MRPALRPPNHLMAAALGPSVAGGQFNRASVLSYLHQHSLAEGNVSCTVKHTAEELRQI